MKRFSCAGLCAGLLIQHFQLVADAAGGGIHGNSYRSCWAPLWLARRWELFREGKLASATTTDAEGKYGSRRLLLDAIRSGHKRRHSNSQRSEAISCGQQQSYGC